MPEYWFTSDHHFDHKNIIKYCERPFSTIHDMNETMIERWNECVEPGDIVFHLGDFAFANLKRHQEILDRLNGTIRLIKGNHDRSRIIKRAGFEWIKQRYEWRVPPSRVRLLTMDHYPMFMWRDSHIMEWHIHGHCHGTLPESPDRLSFDVGVDCWDFYPVHLDELVKIFHRKEKNWRSVVMKHDKPRAGHDGMKLFALVSLSCYKPEIRFRWVEDRGDEWFLTDIGAIKKSDEDNVRCWCYATDFGDIANRLPRGGVKGIPSSPMG